jgi:hypothetical protein
MHFSKVDPCRCAASIEFNGFAKQRLGPFDPPQAKQNPSLVMVPGKLVAGQSLLEQRKRLFEFPD